MDEEANKNMKKDLPQFQCEKCGKVIDINSLLFKYSTSCERCEHDFLNFRAKSKYE